MRRAVCPFFMASFDYLGQPLDSGSINLCYLFEKCSTGPTDVPIYSDFRKNEICKIFLW